MLRLPAPVLPEVVRHVAPERMTARQAGRFRIVGAGLVDGPSDRLGALEGIVHRPRSLQLFSGGGPQFCSPAGWLVVGLVTSRTDQFICGCYRRADEIQDDFLVFPAGKPTLF